MHAEGSEELRRRSKRRVWLMLGTLVLLGAVFTIWSVGRTLVVPNVLQKFAFASRGKAKADLTQLESALEEFAQSNAGHYPKSLRELVTPDMNGHTYIKGTRIPKDPWGNDYLYDPPRSVGDLPIVYTLGKDGRRGGEGDDADMNNLSIREGR